jgi:hypothetical protein
VTLETRTLLYDVARNRKHWFAWVHNRCTMGAFHFSKLPTSLLNAMHGAKALC